MFVTFSSSPLHPLINWLGIAEFFDFFTCYSVYHQLFSLVYSSQCFHVFAVFPRAYAIIGRTVTSYIFYFILILTIKLMYSYSRTITYYGPPHWSSG